MSSTQRQRFGTVVALLLAVSFFTGQSSLTFGEQISMIYKEICFAYMISPEYAWELFKLGSASVRLTLRKIAKTHEVATPNRCKLTKKK